MPKAQSQFRRTMAEVTGTTVFGLGIGFLSMLNASSLTGAVVSGLLGFFIGAGTSGALLYATKRSARQMSAPQPR